MRWPWLGSGIGELVVSDRRWLRPFVAAGILWLVVTLPRAIAPNVPQIVMMTILAVFIGALVGLLMLGLALWNAQFKYAAALLCALAALVVADNVAMRYSDELRWLVFSQYYKTRLSLVAPRDGVSGIEWNAVFSWQADLEYRQIDLSPEGLGARSFTAGYDATCRERFKRLEPHYYIHETLC